MSVFRRHSMASYSFTYTAIPPPGSRRTCCRRSPSLAAFLASCRLLKFSVRATSSISMAVPYRCTIRSSRSQSESRDKGCGLAWVGRTCIWWPYSWRELAGSIGDLGSLRAYLEADAAQVAQGAHQVRHLGVESPPAVEVGGAVVGAEDGGVGDASGVGPSLTRTT